MADEEEDNHYDDGEDESFAESEVLSTKLPPRAARGLASFLLALAGTAFVVSIWVHFPETVHCNFTLVPKEGADPVKAPRRGTILAVAVNEGEEIKAGQVLFEVRSSELRELGVLRNTITREMENDKLRIKELDEEAAARKLSDTSALAELDQRVKRLEIEQEKSKSLTVTIQKKYDSALAASKDREKSYTEELELEIKRVNIQKHLQELVETGFKKGVTAEWEAMRERFGYQQADIELAQARRRLMDAKVEVSTIDITRQLDLAEHESADIKRDGELAETRESKRRTEQDAAARAALAREHIRQLNEQLETNQVRLEGLNNQLKNCIDEDRFRILAPFDGTVMSLQVGRPDVVVELGETLCHLARKDSTIQVELKIPEHDAGKVARNQPLKLLFSAYPYTRYGTKHAVLDWVSPAAADGAFRAFGKLDDDASIVIDGKRTPLRVGLGGEARISTGSHTMLEFIFEPLRQLKENVSK